METRLCGTHGEQRLNRVKQPAFFKLITRNALLISQMSSQLLHKIHTLSRVIVAVACLLLDLFTKVLKLTLEPDVVFIVFGQNVILKVFLHNLPCHFQYSLAKFLLNALTKTAMLLMDRLKLHVMSLYQSRKFLCPRSRLQLIHHHFHILESHSDSLLFALRQFK